MSNPGALLHFGDYVSNVTGMVGGGEGGDSEAAADSNFVGFYARAMYQSIGLPIIVASLIGLMVSLRNKAHAAQIILLFALSFFAVISLSSNPYLVYTRYILPIIPVVLLFAAFGIDQLVQLLGRSIGFGSSMAAILTLLVASGTIAGSVQADLDFGGKDTRTAAREWFDKNVPAGATVLIEGHTGKSINTGVQLRNSRENIERAIWYFEQNEEPGKAKYFRLELRAVDEKRFDLSFYSWNDFNDWESFDEENIEYVVVRPSALQNSPKYRVVGKRFLADLRSDPDYFLAAAFSGDDGNDAAGRGPLIEIYKKGSGR
ncbi:MAG: hypothetical protein IPO61_05625 [Gammaproteobacteria bacterium]|nr:hypothetical protein [Gammaproteobacteria bacterium]